jgi:hypothetical protein
MRIYLAGHSVDLEVDKKITKRRLVSFFHIMPGGLGYKVWKIITKTK